MAHRLEITLIDELVDAEGENIRRNARDYLSLALDRVRVIQVITIDANLTPDQLETIRTDIFTNPVTQVSSYRPLGYSF